MSEIPPSKYTIKISDDKKSFTISGEDRRTVVVENNYSKLTINSYTHVGFYEFRKMLQAIAEELFIDWEPKNPKCKGKAGFIPPKLKDWALTNCKKSIAKKVKTAWLTLLENADPTIVKVHKAVFAVSSKSNGAILDENFYKEENKYLISDIINYRAAALATFYFESYECEEIWNWPTKTKVNLRKNWMKAYGDINNGSLRKTIMNLPGGIPSYLIDAFRLINFKRPVTNRLELLALLSYGHRPSHQNVIMFSNRKQIKQAIKMYADHMREKPNTRSTQYIMNAIRFITDYPEDHNGNIVGLARKSINWHRNNVFTNTGKHSKYKPEHLTALPPIDLPKISGITFLSKVEDLWNEGMVMGHCVGGYDNKAVRGDSFIFHIDYKGEVATVEVNANGRVVQARTKRNQENKACKWATKVLNEWGKAFPPTTYEDVLSANFEPF